ncbi:MAG: L,D-transpeptidase [Polyangiaceae bacterium]|nr:L,D-transpeptidase [Polyangiaceae bacterium]
MARHARIPGTHQVVLLVTISVALLGACKGTEEAATLSKPVLGEELPPIPIPPANGPKLGALADLTPVLERPEPGGKQIGYLHAGAQVARAEEALSIEGCPEGWYPLRPRGFACVGPTATLDLGHPTLVAMSLRPRRDQPLPYTYARTRQATRILKRAADADDRVATVRRLPSRSGLAVVGSWEATDEGGEPLRLGLLTSGLFVPAEDLEAARPSDFRGVELPQGLEDLPIAFNVKQGVRGFKPTKDPQEWEKGPPLEFHQLLRLTGRYRSSGSVQYWAVDEDTWVRHRDVTVIRRRSVFPEFAAGDQRWIDISVVTGTAVLYEGKKPVFATLVSAGRDRLGDPKTTASTALGDFEVTSKHLTAKGLDPARLGDHGEFYDVPWVVELSSGQLMHGAYWHDRFGIEHSPGSVQLSPADAQRVWTWATPDVPDGWHGVNERPKDAPKTLVRIRK